jgi:hypothetical protein
MPLSFLGFFHRIESFDREEQRKDSNHKEHGCNGMREQSQKIPMVHLQTPPQIQFKGVAQHESQNKRWQRIFQPFQYETYDTKGYHSQCIKDSIIDSVCTQCTEDDNNGIQIVFGNFQDLDEM